MYLLKGVKKHCCIVRIKKVHQNGATPSKLVSWVRPRTPGDTPPRLFGKWAGGTSSSLPENKHKAHSDLPWFRPRDGILRKTLRLACLSLLMKMSSEGVQR
jgi:hypothetical protein